ncbi:MAG: efflux RND transporter periplasmic adaptor subunit [Rhizobiales bacterium]|nr:efflux RND transporter periplasmic adaptor subunit [Hyphomicrobiales bacterium]
MSLSIKALALSGLLAVWLTPARAETLRGFVRAIDDAVIATELNARVVAFAYREGDAFRKDDVLIGFDCAKYASDLRAAQAEQKLNAIALESSQVLERRGAGGSFDVQLNKARVDKAVAAVDGLSARVRDCEIRAPFDGHMGEVRIRLHEMSTPNQPLFRIVSAANLEIDLIAPSNYLVWLKPDHEFDVRIEETGATKRVRVARIAAAVDPVSQTVKVTAAFRDDKADVLPGMSVSADLNPPAQR